MTTADPNDSMTDTHAEPPRMLPRDPRPGVDTLRGWPFLLMGTVALGALGFFTIGPAIWSEGQEVAQNDPAPLQLNTSRARNDLPGDYSQVAKRPPEPEPAPTAEPAPEPDPVPQTVIIHQGGGGAQQNTGPTRAELLRAARMADLAPVSIGGSGYQQASMGGAGTGASGGSGRPTGAMYNQNRLTDGFECQVDAGTNIPAMTEQRLTSASPGTVSAIAMRDVWSSDKTCLAIPRGTRFVGRYQTAAAEGQVRMGIMWTGLTRPAPRPGLSGDSIELPDTVAGDPDGTAGVTGEVNNHFWRKLGFVMAASLLDIGKTSITAGGEGGVGAAVAGIFANRATSPIDEWARRQLDIPPVIEVKPREISIVLAQHLPMNDFRARR